MGPGYVQGGTRVPPDHPEGGGSGGVYSECLCETPWGEYGMRNAESGITGQSHPKRLPASLLASRGGGIRRWGRDVDDPGRLRRRVGVALDNIGAVEGLVI